LLNNTAYNVTADVYNVSVSMSPGGVYPYYWASWGNGTNENYNVSALRYYTINISDTINPDITIKFPANLSNYSNQDLNVNYTANDTNMQACWWSNNSGTNNYSLTDCGTNITGQTWPEGSNTIIVWVNDTSNNQNSTAITFTIDLLYPTFSIYKDNNSTLIDSGTAWFNVTINNTNGTVILEIEGTNYTASNTTEKVYNVSVSMSASGTDAYYWGAWSNGSAHNYNASVIRYYTVNASVIIHGVKVFLKPSTTELPYVQLNKSMDFTI